MKLLEQQKQALIPLVKPNYEENFLSPFRNEFVAHLSYDVRIYILEWIMIFHEIVLNTPKLKSEDEKTVMLKYFGYFTDDPNRVPRLLYRSSHIRIMSYFDPSNDSVVVDLNPLPLSKMKNLLLYCSKLNSKSMKRIHYLLTKASKEENGLKHLQLSSLSESAFQNLIKKNIHVEEEREGKPKTLPDTFISYISTFSAMLYFENTRLLDNVIPHLYNTEALKLAFDPVVEISDEAVRTINQSPKLKKLELPCSVSSTSIKYLLGSGRMDLLVINMGLHVFTSPELFSFCQNQNIKHLHCIQGSTEGLSALVAIAMRNTNLLSFSIECGRSNVSNFTRLLSHPTLKSLNLSRIDSAPSHMLAPPKQDNNVLENITIDTNWINPHTIRLVSRLKSLKRLSFMEITAEAAKLKFSVDKLLTILGQECGSASCLRVLSFELHDTTPINNNDILFSDLMIVLKMFPSLEELQLRFTISSKDELDMLLSSLPKLRCLNNATIQGEEAFVALVNSDRMLYASVYSSLPKSVATTVAAYACYQLRVI